MKAQLTANDKKELKNQCKIGYVLPTLIFLLGTAICVVLYELNFNEANSPDFQIDLLIAAGFFVISFLLSFFINRKYIQDLRNNEKVAETKIIQQKSETKDFEAGSGNVTPVAHLNEMKGFFRYDIVVENVKYRIDKELYDICSDGDKLVFYYAPKSKYLLSIEKA